MQYRPATPDDIPAITSLQAKYHIDSISSSDKPDGFVTTLFTPEQLQDLINDINNEGNVIMLAITDHQVVGYAMNAGWGYWSQWAFFQHMMADLPNVQFNGQFCTPDNSYQYGPVCIDKAYRGGKGEHSVLRHLFEQSCLRMAPYYPILLTFINHNNPRSYHAHVNKLGLTVIKNFRFNDNDYYELGYATHLKVKD